MMYTCIYIKSDIPLLGDNYCQCCACYLHVDTSLMGQDPVRYLANLIALKQRSTKVLQWLQVLTMIIVVLLNLLVILVMCIL